MPKSMKRFIQLKAGMGNDIYLVVDYEGRVWRLNNEEFLNTICTMEKNPTESYRSIYEGDFEKRSIAGYLLRTLHMPDDLNGETDLYPIFDRLWNALSE